MRKKLAVAVLSILAIVALVFVIGLFLPKQREFVKTATFKSSPEKVFQIVTDLKTKHLGEAMLRKSILLKKTLGQKFQKRNTLNL